MTIPSFTCRALLLLGAAACLVRPAVAGDRIYVSESDVCDAACEQPRCAFGVALHRKFRLQCVYFKRACTMRYVALPYTQPNSAMYYGPFMNDGYVTPAPTSPS